MTKERFMSVTKREKPQGVGINKIPVRALVEFGRAHGYIDDDDLVSPGEVPMIGSLLCDWAIREFVTIEDFVDYDQCPKGVVSYGITSSGYDIRVGGRFKIFTNALCETVSPKNISDGCFLNVDLTGHDWVLGHKGSFCVRCKADLDTKAARMRCVDPKPGTADIIKIPPNSFALAETIELLHIPRNINCLCLGKSTYARCGIIMNFTPFEPGWRGVVTVEISNSTPLPVAINAWQGIGQAQFALTVGKPEKSYSEKANAKYMDQGGLTLPSVK